MYYSIWKRFCFIKWMYYSICNRFCCIKWMYYSICNRFLLYQMNVLQYLEAFLLYQMNGNQVKYYSVVVFSHCKHIKKLNLFCTLLYSVSKCNVGWSIMFISSISFLSKCTFIFYFKINGLYNVIKLWFNAFISL